MRRIGHAAAMVFLFVILYTGMPLKAETENWYYRLSIGAGAYAWLPLSPLITDVRHSFLWPVSDNQKHLLGFTFTVAPVFEVRKDLLLDREGEEIPPFPKIELLFSYFKQVKGTEPGAGFYFSLDAGLISKFQMYLIPYMPNLLIRLGLGNGWAISNTTRILLGGEMEMSMYYYLPVIGFDCNLSFLF